MADDAPKMSRPALVLAIACLWSACAVSPNPPPREAARTPPVRVRSPAPEPVPALSCAVARDVEPLALPLLASEREPSRDNLRRWVELLAGPELRGREAGTPDARRAARSIADYFTSIGASPPGNAGHCQAFEGEGFRDQNVVAHLPSGKRCGSLIVGAHYDALGVGEDGRIRPGADDNASGVAVLLELARLAQAGAVQHELDLVLVAFGGEEKDLTGSREYVEAPSVPLSDVRLMVNIDMVGRKPQGYPVIGYEASGRERALNARRVRAAAKTAGVNAVAMALGDRGDSASFSPHVPALFLCTTVHADYHQPTDTPDRVDYEQTERALGLLIALVEGLDCDTDARTTALGSPRRGTSKPERAPDGSP